MIDTNNRNWQFLQQLSNVVNWDKIKALNRNVRRSYYLDNKDNKKNPFRSRVCMIELYPEHDEDMSFLYELIVSDAYPYACILHDKDVFDSDSLGDEDGLGAHKKGDQKKPHIHVVVKFEHGKTNTAVAKLFLLNTRFVEMWDSTREALAYLDHHKYIDKHHYDYKEIFGNLSCEVFQAHPVIKDKYQAIDTIIEYIAGRDYTSMDEVYRFCRKNILLDCLFSRWSQVNTLVIEHNMIQKMINERNQKNEI